MPIFSRVILFLLCIVAAVATAAAQSSDVPRSQEFSDEDENLPVLVKHLPDWEAKRKEAKYFFDDSEFRSFLKGRQISKSLDFFPGTEAVFAKYPEGELLIVEYSTPQASAAINKQVKENAQSSGDYFIYRRIGNYNVFLFDPTNESAGNKLLDKIKYEKVVTWPWGDPNPFFEKERAFITEGSSLFIGIVVFIVTGLGGALFVGIITGIVYYKTADRRRAAMGFYSDAGGLTRLNIDGLTTNAMPENLLDESDA